jgi:hypothetical protein
VVNINNFQEEYRKQEQPKINPLLYTGTETEGKSLDAQGTILLVPKMEKPESGPHRFASTDFDPEFRSIHTPEMKPIDSEIVVSG